jgi:hypothetical protein
MTIDQLLYVAARIHNPEKPVLKTVERALEIVTTCETAIEANNDFEDMNMKSRGLSPDEMMREAREKREKMGAL